MVSSSRFSPTARAVVLTTASAAVLFGAAAGKPVPSGEKGSENGGLSGGSNWWDAWGSKGESGAKTGATDAWGSKGDKDQSGAKTGATDDAWGSKGDKDQSGAKTGATDAWGSKDDKDQSGAKTGATDAWGSKDGADSKDGSYSELDRGAVSAADINDAAIRVLCLHGGGGTGAMFAPGAEPGFRQLTEAFPNAEFVFDGVDGAYGTGSNRLWIRDPPGGKNTPNADPSWADASVAVVDEIVRERGPFDVLLGYSQGSAFAAFYLSRPGRAQNFARAALFNGYLPETHTGLMASINRAPLTTPAMVFVGEQDVGFRYGGDGLAGAFATATQVRSATAGHHFPHASDPTFGQVVAFMAGAEITGTNGQGDATAPAGNKATDGDESETESEAEGNDKEAGLGAADEKGEEDEPEQDDSNGEAQPSPCSLPGWKTVGSVCAASKIGGQCHRRVTKAAAVEVCAAANARLCTVTELAAKVAKGTGCQLDNKYVWASDSGCTGSLSRAAKGKHGRAPKCLGSKKTAGVRCCSSTP